MRPPREYTCDSRTTLSFGPRVYSTSAVMGAEYVMSRKRQSCGVNLFVWKLSVTVGAPTYTLVYLYPV